MSKNSFQSSAKRGESFGSKVQTVNCVQGFLTTWFYLSGVCAVSEFCILLMKGKKTKARTLL